MARFHLDTLGERGHYYSSAAELIDLLTNFDRHARHRKDFNAYRPFEPQAVAKTFEKVFLSPKKLAASFDETDAKHAGKG